MSCFWQPCEQRFIHMLRPDFISVFVETNISLFFLDAKKDREYFFTNNAELQKWFYNFIEFV